MTHMTPDQAQIYLRAYRDDRTGYIPSYAVDALEALAADTLEYGVEYTGRNTGYRFTDSDASWHTEQYLAVSEYRRMKKSGMNPRLVARRVSEPWEVTDGDI